MPFSPETAQTIYHISRVLVLLGSLASLAGTVGWFWSDSARLARTVPAVATPAVAASASPAPAAETKSAPERKISAEQAAVLVARLKFLAKAPVRMAHAAHDPEAREFSSSLQKVLAEAGFAVSAVGEQDAAQPGLTLVVGNGAEPPDAAMELLGALGEVGIPCAGVANNQPEMTDIYLLVGPRQAP